MLDHDVDIILIMSVNPALVARVHPAMNEKHSGHRAMIGNRPIDIQVDGGVTAETIGAATAAGANVFVAGSAVFKGNSVESYATNITNLRNAAGAQA